MCTFGLGFMDYGLGFIILHPRNPPPILTLITGNFDSKNPRTNGKDGILLRIFSGRYFVS